MPELPSERATEIVANRGVRYGHPRPIFETTASFWNEWLAKDRGALFEDGMVRSINPEDVPVLMALHKIAREKYAPSPHQDNLDDVVGFINTREMMDWPDNDQPARRR